MMESLLALILLALLAWYWQDGLKAREVGVAAAREACAAEGLQFLDDTVAQSGLRLLRGEDGRMRLQRSFAFEYSFSGDDRQPGYVTLLGHEVTMLHTSARPPEEPPPALH
ncbi:DUF3301 domain-containing protein [Uliginosibacterium sp. 31-16]|uniref:DUF3301 domain-containing protein n=1 Tax=Uliginosibacterium sp. 31-16 TaxID=3068315 RepID=UPI00353270FC